MLRWGGKPNPQPHELGEGSWVPCSVGREISPKDWLKREKIKKKREWVVETSVWEKELRGKERGKEHWWQSGPNPTASFMLVEKVPILALSSGSSSSRGQDNRSCCFHFFSSYLSFLDLSHPDLAANWCFSGLALWCARAWVALIYASAFFCCITWEDAFISSLFGAVRKTLVCQVSREFKIGQLASRSAQLEMVTSIFDWAALPSGGALIKLTTVQGW